MDSPASHIGMPPGTLLHRGEQKIDQSVLSVIAYNQEGVLHEQNISLEKCIQIKQQYPVAWLNLSGLHDVDLVSKVGEQLDIHPLILEDILNTQHYPKIETHENCTLIILKILTFEESTCTIESEQLSLILGNGYVLSFQERPGRLFSKVSERITALNSRLRARGCDYLLYALCDSVVDSYLFLAGILSDKLLQLEEEILEHIERDVLSQVYLYKRQLNVMRKAVWPVQDIVLEMQRYETGMFDESTAPYLRDLFDHSIHVIHSTETLQETSSALIELSMSLNSNRMNEVMQVLTIMASIFIPLTFIAGVYGMNFAHMPELQWPWAYPAVLLFMFICAIGMLLVFKRKGWLK